MEFLTAPFFNEVLCQSHRHSLIDELSYQGHLSLVSHSQSNVAEFANLRSGPRQICIAFTTDSRVFSRDCLEKGHRSNGLPC